MSPAAHLPSPTQAQQEFTRLLRELFQLDQSDLDFGIYRIMKLRAKDVEAFITDELPQTLQAARQELATRGLDDVRADRDEARQQLRQNFGLDVASPEAVATQETQLGAVPIFRDTLARYRTAQTQLDQAALAEDLERTIYNDLYRFFARYYDSGDFVTQPRAGDAAYMLPYNGEEVKLYWANHDQYYIKTGENFRHYRFDVGQVGNADDLARLTVEFELTDADTAAGNNLNKKGRVFLPASPDDYFQFDAAARRLTLRFRFAVPTDDEAARWGSKQSVAKDDKGVNERILLDVGERIRATADAYLLAFWQRHTHERGGQPVNALVYHLHRYTLPNHFDYFIHRNLGRFLGQELDYYLKHELLDLQFLGADWSRPAQLQAMQQQLLRASVVRTVALRLVAFLHELEEYQRHLFEKKKLVVGAEYCISLDLLPAPVRPAVLAHLLANTEPARQQLRAWQTLGMVPATEAGTAALRDFLAAPAPFDPEHAYARLPLDTHYLTLAETAEAAALRDELLGAFDDLDGQTTGVLINSENWQALNVLQGKYSEQIECVYIDPPYNTGGGDFLYKDAFQHSSWLSMIHDRVELAKSALSQSGVLFSSIDDIELVGLRNLLDNAFSPNNKAGTIIWKGATDNNPTRISIEHEYVLAYVKNLAANASVWQNSTTGSKELILDEYERLKTEGNSISVIQAKLRAYIKTNAESLNPLTHYNIVDEDGPYTGARKVHNPGKEGYRYDVKHPITDGVCVPPARGYRYPEDAMNRLIAADKIIFGKDENQIVQIKEYLKDYQGSFKGLIELDGRVAANALEGLFGSREIFKNPKPIELISSMLSFVTSGKDFILDFFAGSGTTGHAVINLNREDEDGEGSRRFILVEMGEYFDTVTKPRVLKAAYSSTWQGGQAHAPTAGMSQLVQVLRLEQYEDTLNNMAFVEVPQDPTTGQLFFAHSPEDRLRYVLARSAGASRPTLGPAVLDTPFAYKLDIVLANERRQTAVDLVASFALLLGLHTERLWVERGPEGRLYRLLRGHRRGLRHLCIWRTAPGHGLDEAAQDAALAAERDWVQAQPWYEQAQAAHAVVYCNAQQLFGAESAEAELHRLLFNG